VNKTSDLLTRDEAAAYLGVSPATLATWASTKRYPLPFVKIGRAVKYRVAALDKFIEARTTGAAE
jgi:excisionase family DNA binding protein